MDATKFRGSLDLGIIIYQNDFTSSQYFAAVGRIDGIGFDTPWIKVDGLTPLKLEAGVLLVTKTCKTQ